MDTKIAEPDVEIMGIMMYSRTAFLQLLNISEATAKQRRGLPKAMSFAGEKYYHPDVIKGWFKEQLNKHLQQFGADKPAETDDKDSGVDD